MLAPPRAGPTGGAGEAPPARVRGLVRGGRRREVRARADPLEPLLEAEGPVVEGRRQPEAEIDQAIKTTSEKVGPQHIPVRFWQERNTLNFALGGEEPGHTPREATIWLGVVQTSGTVDVKQGENEGKQLTYTNIVRELTPIGIWKGQPLEIQLPRAALMQAEVQKIVVLLQEDRSGPIIGGTLAGLW